MEPIEFDGLLTVCALSNNDHIGDVLMSATKPWRTTAWSSITMI